MKRWGAVVVLITVSLWAVAQSTGNAASTGGASGAVMATPAPVTYPGYAGIAGAVSTNTGTAFVAVPASQPMMVTPIVHLGTAAPVVGATNATPGNMAGAVNSTLANVTALPPIGVVTEYANQVPVVMESQSGGAPVPVAAGSSGVTISGTINPGVRFNTGVGSSSGAYPVGTMAVNQVSLGEIARRNRAREAGVQARSFTNQDIERINQSSGVSVSGGASGATVTAMPNNNGVINPNPGTAPAVSQPAGTVNQPAAPGVAVPAPPSNQAQPTPPMSQNQAGAAAGESPAEMAQATPSAETAQSSLTAAQRGGQELPRTGSVLPLMALVGFLAAAAGLMAR